MEKVSKGNLSLTFFRRGSVNQPLLKTLPCQPGDFEVCQIKPSTMYFTQSKMAALESAGHDRLVSVSQVKILYFSTNYFFNNK